MLQRCFDARRKVINPTYKDVTCCDEWLSFANFLEWANKDVGYSGKPSGFELDKDILMRGNKVYSPEACSFVPQAVNKLLHRRSKPKSDLPVGVYYHVGTGKFVTYLGCNGRQTHVGLYETPEEASLSYMAAKEAQIKTVALQHKAVLKPAVFESLMNWSVEP